MRIKQAESGLNRPDPKPDLDNANVGTHVTTVTSDYTLSIVAFLFSRRRKEDKKMNASVAIQTLPEAANDEELIRIVDEVIAYIKSTGLNYYVGPFETAIEGDYDELMDIVKECQHIAIRAGAPSVAAYIKVTYKPEGDVLTIEKKVTKHH